ncbi:hypothetical protein WG906_06405 [Pedobacter sp. P351]|uniref:hypothetical protein n=1 Tax=Pedobacter superstes TaxID=3133441 RepID=UPI00309A6F17
MKKNKFLLILAFLCASISLASNSAMAQTSAPVILNTRVVNYENGASGVSWYVALHNNTTNEDFYFETGSSSLREDGYHMGNVTAGTYTVKVSYYSMMFWYTGWDWYANDQSGYKGMYGGNEYELTDSLVVSDVYTDSNYGVNLYLFTN